MNLMPSIHLQPLYPIVGLSAITLNIVLYFFLDYVNIRFLFNEGMYIRDLFKELEPERQFQVISTVVLDIVEGILAIQAERDSCNDASDALPPTLPLELAKIRGKRRNHFGTCRPFTTILERAKYC
jgi:hypothetical protein